MNLHNIRTAETTERLALLAWFQKIFEDRYSFEIHGDHVWEQKAGEDEFHKGQTTVAAWIKIMNLAEAPGRP